ncbi:unnamed protein product, partial [marine sediment metagenome]
MYEAKYLQPQVSTKGLLAHWKMWDGFASSGKVFDYALNANLGTTTMISYGAYPGYLFVDGSQINCGSDSTLDNLFDGGGSFSGWLKPLDQGQANAGRVFAKTNAANTAGVVLWCNASDTKLTFIQSTTSTDGNWTFPVDMTDGPWQHILVTYNASTAAAGGAPVAYVNGVAVVVTEVAAPDAARDSDAAVAMYIGQNSAGGKSWNGKMDDLMFFNR